MKDALPWALLLLCALLGAVVVYSLAGRLQAEAYARREAEASALREKGAVVAERRTREKMALEAGRLEDESNALRAELEKIRKAAPLSRTVATAKASTGPVAVNPQETSSGPGGGADSPPASPSRCLLEPGDMGEIVVREVFLETLNGNRIVAGAAEAYRDDPRILLFGGPFSAPLTSVGVVADEPKGWPPWITGAAAGSAMALGFGLGYAVGR